MLTLNRHIKDPEQISRQHRRGRSGSLQCARQVRSHFKPAPRQIDRRFHHGVQRQRAPPGMEFSEAQRFTGNAYRQPANSTCSLILGSRKHVHRCGRGRHLSEVQYTPLTRRMNEDGKSASAKAAARRLHHSCCQSCGHCGIHRITAFRQYRSPRSAGQAMIRGDHPTGCSLGRRRGTKQNCNGNRQPGPHQSSAQPHAHATASAT